MTTETQQNVELSAGSLEDTEATPAIEQAEAAYQAEHQAAVSYQKEWMEQPTDPASQEQPNQTEQRYQPKKRRRRFGDRKEGHRLRSIDPISYVSPFIMSTRCGSTNMISDRIDMAPIEKYLREKKQQGHAITLMHVLIAAYVRTVATYPGINRFISGQRAFARHGIEVMLTIKKEMSLESPETVVKAFFAPDDTIYDVEAEFTRLITLYREENGSALDGVAKLLKKVPRFLLRGVVGFLKFLDYYGWLPRFLTKVSCFHGSFFITSMGSLGIPPIYHHLYEFGNVPTFMSFGAKQRRNVLLDDGTVKREQYVDFTIVMDERICDGFYYASALKHLKRILKNPYVLDNRPEQVIEDVD